MAYVGFDFGTTNSVVALCDDAGHTRTLRYAGAEGDVDTFRSVVCYVGEDEDAYNARIRVFCGPAAIPAFVANGENARLIQSVKTFLSSRNFTSSVIHGREYTLEQILGDFFAGLAAAARERDGATIGATVTAGRPVRFAGHHPDQDLAQARIRNAFLRIGVTQVDFALEPLAAAYFFAGRLQEPATVLVADLGGGTSDFSVVAFDPASGSATPLAHTGVGIAGDSLDFRIIQEVVAPAFGKGSRYRPWDKWLEVPSSIYFEFEQWHRLSFLKRPEVMRQLEQVELVSEVPAQIAALRIFLQRELGFDLYRAVSKCKTALSAADHAVLEFVSPPIDLRKDVRRADFERWIARDLTAIDAACTDALTSAKLRPDEISVVFMTGGTSFVPAIRDRFAARFGQEKLVFGDEFVSVANGLALLARDRTRGGEAKPR